MEVLMILLPLALILGVLFLGFYWWAVKNGQFDDITTPAHRVLLDADKADQNESEAPN